VSDSASCDQKLTKLRDRSAPALCSTSPIGAGEASSAAEERACGGGEEFGAVLQDGPKEALAAARKDSRPGGRIVINHTQPVRSRVATNHGAPRLLGCSEERDAGAGQLLLIPLQMIPGLRHQAGGGPAGSAHARARDCPESERHCGQPVYTDERARACCAAALMRMLCGLWGQRASLSKRGPTGAAAWAARAGGVTRRTRVFAALRPASASFGV
jgi:hypothetical protein